MSTEIFKFYWKSPVITSLIMYYYLLVYEQITRFIERYLFSRKCQRVERYTANTASSFFYKKFHEAKMYTVWVLYKLKKNISLWIYYTRSELSAILPSSNNICSCSIINVIRKNYGI